MAPLILEAQAKGTIGAVILTAEKTAEALPLGNYTLNFTLGRMRRPPVAAQAPTGAPPAQPSSYAIAISTGPDDYVLVGNGVQVTFTPNGAESSTAAIGALEEGVYVEGRWIPGRRLNGDDIMVNYNAQNQAVKGQSGQGLRLAGDAPRIVRVKLYRY